MKTSLPLAAALTLLSALAAGAASCGGDTILQKVCDTNQECIESHDDNPNWFCHDRGQCACLNDDACPVGEGGERTEHCNAIDAGGDGLCHPNRLCELNSDCKNGELCGEDGVCRKGCVSDLQCDVGQICDRLKSVCVSGCFDHGDCKLRQACMCKDPVSGKYSAECACDRSSENWNCVVGKCSSDVCPDKTFCNYGELCVPGEDGLKHCQKDDRGQYCENCSLKPGEETYCGSKGPDFCLVDQTDPARMGSFCGVDCDRGQECPNGYGCIDILRPTQNLCTASSQCLPPAGAPSCDVDADCPPGARCSGGRCAGNCFGGEGSTSGWCSCVTDEECPQDTCGSGNRCIITRKACIPGPADTCRDAIRCVNDGGVGYCRIGANCAPENGLNCAEIKDGVK